jgi:hypothetical protein
VDTDLRVSIIAAAAAALLSALVGIIAGVPFGILLLRALLGGAVFGSIVYGGYFVARRFLPVAPGAQTAGQASETEAGSHSIDIVLPGETPDGFLGRGRAEEAEDFGKPLDEMALAGGAPRESSLSLSPDDDDDADSGLEEVGSLLPPEDGEGKSAAVPRPESAGGTAFDDLDVLPDLDGFSETFAGTEFAGSSEPAETALSRRPDSRFKGGQRGGDGSEHPDPASLAQAVRTILKRDQKG